jgi:hypothetical protein
MSTSVRVIKNIPPDRLEDLDVVLCKGIGYVVVNNAESNADSIRRMGEVVAKTIEEGKLHSKEASLHFNLDDEVREVVDISIGDIVYLKSNIDMAMTVRSVQTAYETVTVNWFSKSGELHQKDLQIETLISKS